MNSTYTCPWPWDTEVDKAWSPDRKTGLKRDSRNPTMSSGARISPEDHGPRRVMPELSLGSSAVTEWRQAGGGRWREQPGSPSADDRRNRAVKENVLSPCARPRGNTETQKEARAPKADGRKRSHGEVAV